MGASLFSSSRRTRSCFRPSVLHPRTLRSALRSTTLSRLSASNWGKDSGVVLEYSSGTSGTALCREVAASSLALLSSLSRYPIFFSIVCSIHRIFASRALIFSPSLTPPHGVNVMCRPVGSGICAADGFHAFSEPSVR